MAYITPITDRDAADIAAQNSKAYWNAADWERVYNNSRLTRDLTEILLSAPIAFTHLPTVTVATVPYGADFTNFLAFLTNIETLRLAVVGESIPGTSTEINDNWIPGRDQDAPDYMDANLWESTIDAIWEYYNGPDLLVCPTLTGDLTITTGNQAIYVDCIDCADFNIDLQGTANLFII